MIVTVDEVVNIGLVGLRLIVADLQNAFHGFSAPFFVYFVHYTPDGCKCKGQFREKYIGIYDKTGRKLVKDLNGYPVFPGHKETPHGRCRQISNLHELCRWVPYPESLCFQLPQGGRPALEGGTILRGPVN